MALLAVNPERRQTRGSRESAQGCPGRPRPPATKRAAHGGIRGQAEPEIH